MTGVYMNFSFKITDTTMVQNIAVTRMGLVEDTAVTLCDIIQATETIFFGLFLQTISDLTEIMFTMFIRLHSI